MKAVRVSAGLCAIAALIGCTTTRAERGVVAMKMNDTEAHVDIGSPALAVGDHVELYHHICEKRVCHKHIGGEGVVSKIVSGDYSVVEFPAGTEFSQGDAVEKRR
jgi:hypothetical protein